MRPSTLSFSALLPVVLLLACDSPSKEAPPPASAPAGVDARTAEPEAKVVPSPAVATEVKPAVAEPASAVEAAMPPTEAAPEAKAKEPSPSDAASVRKADEGRPAKAFTDCKSSEAFADGRCYSSREAACEALSCAGKCIHTRSMPPQVVCG